MTTSSSVPRSTDLKTRPLPNVRSVALMVLGVLASGLLFYQLGSVPLFDVDEPRYAQAAREMIQRQDWITPYFNGQVRFDKPVFYYWLIALSYKCFGVSEWSARLVSVVSTLLAAGGIWGVCRLFAPALAPYIALVFLTSLQVVGIGRMSITDMNLMLWMTLTTLTAYWAIQPGKNRFWLLAGALSGVGMLTKGPVALVLPGLVTLLAAAWQGKIKAILQSVWPWLGAALGLAIALPWYWACYQANGQPFIDALLLHNVSRFEGVVSGHSQPWYFYPLVIIAGSFPWTCFLPSAFIEGWKAWRSEHADRQLAQFALIWALTVFGFFAAAQTKLLTHMMPLFPALAILVAFGFFQAPRHMLLLQARVNLVVSIGLSAAMIFGLERLLPREATGIASHNVLVWMGVACTVTSAMVERLIARDNRSAALLTQVSGFGLMCLLAFTWLIPHVSQVTHAPVQLVRDIIATRGDMPVATYEMQRPSLTFYLNKPVPGYQALSKLVAAVEQLPANQTMLLLTKNNRSIDIERNLPTCTVIQKTPIHTLFDCKRAAKPVKP